MSQKVCMWIDNKVLRVVPVSTIPAVDFGITVVAEPYVASVTLTPQ
jgi:hypothetical protein